MTNCRRKGDDVLKGDRRRCAEGRPGNDVLLKADLEMMSYAAGRMMFKGGSGDDVLRGGTGDDVLKGGSGDDKCSAEKATMY